MLNGTHNRSRVKSSNAEPWTPGHSATLSSPARGQAPLKSPLAAQGPHKVETSSRDRANPGTGVGRHPTSEEHLDSPRGPGVGRSRAGSQALRRATLLRQAPLGPRLHWLGHPDATSTQQVGRAFPSHPTLLSVGGCKRGSTPRSSYTTPSTLPREEGASSFSRTGGTAGWLLNLRPGTRGYGLL